MSEPVDLTKLQKAAVALIKACDEFGARVVLIGGFAFSLVVEPRFTRDVDAMMLQEEHSILDILAALQEHGIVPRIDDAADFARKNRVLLLEFGATSSQIDLALGVLPYESEMIERSETLPTPAGQVRVLSPEDLVITKAVAMRNKDQRDIAMIVDAYPDLNKPLIVRTVQGFADLLDMPEMVEQVRHLLY